MDNGKAEFEVREVEGAFADVNEKWNEGRWNKTGNDEEIESVL
jgi:hypothetical protein